MSRQVELNAYHSCHRCIHFFIPDRSNRGSTPEILGRESRANQEHCTQPDGDRLFGALTLGFVSECPEFSPGRPHGLPKSNPNMFPDELYQQTSQGAVTKTGGGPLHCPICGKLLEISGEVETAVCSDCTTVEASYCDVCGKFMTSTALSICSECRLKISSMSHLQERSSEDLTDILIRAYTGSSHQPLDLECTVPMSASIESLLPSLLRECIDESVWNSSGEIEVSIINKRSGHRYRATDCFDSSTTRFGDEVEIVVIVPKQSEP